MLDADANLSALLGSRICHDLISPIGAINNGLELLAMTSQGAGSPEMVLIQDSCRSASARIRFFRVAFGVASPAQRMGPGELRGIIADFTEGSRLRVDWSPEIDASRAEAQLAFLGILCAETAMPFGGTLKIDESGGRWKLTAKADTFKIDPEIWDNLPAGDLVAAKEPGLVQFCLLRLLAAEHDREITVKQPAGGLQLLV
ncbi:histidine phosphotransferase family protein [Pseudaestuariivita atlantica]|uniref:Histidine phosphotransferase ChpT C-terminal domain-containing protein n=1 Tax=Pseudaestuariivita atlantica TaxID=1317121 RepID=A0A0L1JUE4_9RHOB|nr:histidine phosphotransferase family protein [Pseudaestuariivita atlantica]KNG95013.1 hypothetical protein ATO11_06540 [Pseudaestuariivita atlantica]